MFVRAVGRTIFKKLEILVPILAIDGATCTNKHKHKTIEYFSNSYFKFPEDKKALAGLGCC